MSAAKGGEAREERDHANHSAPIPVSPAKMALVPDQPANEPVRFAGARYATRSVALSLDPNVNMWDVAAPYVKGWIRDELGPEAKAADVARRGTVMDVSFGRGKARAIARSRRPFRCGAG